MGKIKNKTIIGMLIGFFVIILIPIIINFIVKIDCFDKILSGQTGDWIMFFGSYLGGIITASISFVILFITIKYNKTQKEIDNNVERLNKLKEELAYRITLFAFMKIGNIALLVGDNFNSQAENLKLNDYHFELTCSFNAFNLIYEHREEEYIVAFMNEYDKCIRKLHVVINEMTTAISEQDMREINDIISSFTTIKKEFVEPVYISAQNWIKKEEEIINNMNKYKL